MVYSGFRFVQAAAKAGLPIAAVNLGRTRGDDLLSLKVSHSCAQALEFLLPRAAACRFAATRSESAHELIHRRWLIGRAARSAMATCPPQGGRPHGMPP
jgi:hypothetical protein